MKRPTALLFILVFATPLLAQTNSLAPGPVAFVNVNVIPMDKERVLRHQTVLVRDGMIAEIGDARRIKIPKDAHRIDGTGKFLIPGLTDMHVHLFSDDEFLTPSPKTSSR